MKGGGGGGFKLIPHPPKKTTLKRPNLTRVIKQPLRTFKLPTSFNIAKD